jgi:hypothetical protein
MRVQLAGDNYLSLAEVEVRSGASGGGCVANVPNDRWRGEYYNNTTLTGSPAMARDDGPSFLNFDFGNGSPGWACGLGVDFFSARWTRTINFAAGTYRFYVTGDDGVRLYNETTLPLLAGDGRKCDTASIAQLHTAAWNIFTPFASSFHFFARSV